MSDVLVIGGGPSLQQNSWRRRLGSMPSIAINHHAHAAGIHTDMFVGGDKPNPGGYTPIEVLEDPDCAKFFYRRNFTDAVDQYPHVHWTNMNERFDLFVDIQRGDNGLCNYGRYVQCTMNLCVRLLCGLKLRSLHLIGVDLTPKSEYSRHRTWLSGVVPVLRERWGMTFTSLSEDNDVECFESAA